MVTIAVVGNNESVRIQPYFVYLDLKIPNHVDHSLMKEVRKYHLKIECIMLISYWTFEDAKRFFQHSGFDYLLKPLQLAEVQLVLEKLSQKLNEKYPQPIYENEEIGSNTFMELVEYIQNHFTEKFSLEQLSKKFGLSSGYICNLF